LHVDFFQYNLGQYRWEY